MWLTSIFPATEAFVNCLTNTRNAKHIKAEDSDLQGQTENLLRFFAFIYFRHLFQDVLKNCDFDTIPRWPHQVAGPVKLSNLSNLYVYYKATCIAEHESRLLRLFTYSSTPLVTTTQDKLNLFCLIRSDYASITFCVPLKIESRLVLT